MNPTAFGVLALDAAGSGAARGSASWLIRNRDRDGGWGFAPGKSDADSTGAVLQALAAAGSARTPSGAASHTCARSSGAAAGSVVGRRPQRPVHGLAIQGLIAAGVSPASVRRGGNSPSTISPRLQAPDGHYRYRAPATRPRSGSQRRRCRRSSALHSRLPRWAAAPPRPRRDPARVPRTRPGRQVATETGEMPLRPEARGRSLGRRALRARARRRRASGGIPGTLRDRRR